MLDSQDTPTIAFIGAGNMASSIIGGLIQNQYPANQLWAVDRNSEKLEQLESKFGIQTSKDMEKALSNSQVIVIAVKPQGFQNACQQIHSHLNGSPLIISVAAGVTLSAMNQYLGDLPMIRSMPNTPALVGQGVTGLFANEKVDASQKAFAKQLFESVGIAEWVATEAQMDAVTALSGSGPAYFFLLMEAMEQAALTLDLSPEIAKAFTLQTALGAAHMAHKSEDSPGTLRQKVTSPGGTTEKAIQTFQAQGFEQCVLEALTAATLRSKELSK